ncbi:hypothetical protein GN956_G10728 [Arapaima gigas]
MERSGGASLEDANKPFTRLSTMEADASLPVPVFFSDGQTRFYSPAALTHVCATCHRCRSLSAKLQLFVKGHVRAGGGGGLAELPLDSVGGIDARGHCWAAHAKTNMKGCLSRMCTLGQESAGVRLAACGSRHPGWEVSGADSCQRPAPERVREREPRLEGATAGRPSCIPAFSGSVETFWER